MVPMDIYGASPWLSGKESTCNIEDAGDMVRSLGWEDPLEEGVEPTPVLLPGESHGQRNLTGYSLWGHKESDTTEMTPAHSK